MTHTVVYSRRSRRDLEKVRAYVATEGGDDATANRLVAELLKACDSLATLPERYGTYPHARRWRMVPVGNYLVFFRIQQTEVLIGHVRHGARRPLQ